MKLFRIYKFSLSASFYFSGLLGFLAWPGLGICRGDWDFGGFSLLIFLAYLKILDCWSVGVLGTGILFLLADISKFSGSLMILAHWGLSSLACWNFWLTGASKFPCLLGFQARWANPTTISFWRPFFTNFLLKMMPIGCFPYPSCSYAPITPATRGVGSVLLLLAPI